MTLNSDNEEFNFEDYVKPTFVEEEVEEFKKFGLMDYINDLTQKNGHILRECPAEMEDRIAQWAKMEFIVCRGLGFGVSNVLVLNEANTRPGMTPLMVYDFLYYALPKGKQYNKWHKPDDDYNTKVISDFYKYTYTKAKSVVNLFDEEEIIRMARLLYGDDVDTSKVRSGKQIAKKGKPTDLSEIEEMVPTKGKKKKLKDLL